MSKPDGKPPSPNTAADLFAGQTPVRELLHACDWSNTPLGDPCGWPQSLKAVVRIMLTSRFAIWMAWGPELTFLCNDAYLPTVGMKRDWVIGSRSDKVWAEIWPDIGPRIERVLTTGESTWDEALQLYLERSGFLEESYHTFSYSPLSEDDGAINGMLCVVAEVTERVIGERQLAMLRDLGTRLAAASNRTEVMRALEDCLAAEPRDMPFALAYLADKEGKTVDLSAVHGLTRGGPGVAEHLPFEQGESPWSQACVDVAPQMVADFALAHWQQRPEKALVAPFRRTEGGAPVGYLVAGLNPHRALDAGYLGFVELMTAQVSAAISRADAYERERERAAALVEIDRAKTAFFSNVSHEFRTPLTLMLGPLEDALAEAADLPPAQRERLDVAHRNGARLLRLVNALLEFSRIEAGRIDVSYQPTDLSELTAELASSFRSATDRAGLDLKVDAPALPAPVYVDRGMWEKIVLNLLSNAFKFTLDGAISVGIVAQDDAVCLIVSDTGTGIPPHELPKLFDRFHRVEGAKGRSFEGSGIGLALVQELVRLHGGEIAVESEWGRGTTFTVRLPYGKAHLPEDRIIAPGAPPPMRSRNAFVEEALRWLPEGAGEDEFVASPDADASSSERVLLADDNADLRNYIARLLSERGYAVETATDGSVALEAARRARPALLITDVMMPRLDGFGLLREVRQDPALRDLPVLMLSARAGEEAKIEGLDAGADDYLTKPFSARELLARVAANIAMARIRREAREAIEASQAEAQAQSERVKLALDAGAIVGVWLFEPGQDRLIGDEKFARSFGLDAESVRVGVPLAAAMHSIHEDDRARVGAEVADALRRGGPYRCEYRVQPSQGVYRWIEANGHVQLGDDGEAVRFPGVLIDIDHRRGIEDELRRLNEELEARVAKAIAEREEAESALRQAQKMEAVGQLTGGIAHDFNNLLTIIAGNVETARRALAAGNRARAERAIDNAHKGSERAAALTQRLLAFSRRQPLAPKPIEVDKLVAGMSDLLNRALGETIQLDVSCEPGLWRIEADPNQLENAILNLAVNARDAMPKGGRLTIASRNLKLENGAREPGAAKEFVCIAVSDTGEGMTKQVLDRVFDPFFTTKPVGKGTGLGLSMVYGFVNQSGGAVDISSTPFEGTTVSIRFPRLIVHDEQSEASSQARRPQADTDKTILVVEDDEDVRAYMLEAVKELGFRVLGAEDGASALRILQDGSSPIDLLITDVVMPGMSGRELVERARALRAGLKTLYSSGYTPDPNFFGDGGVSPAEMIAKPFSYLDLSAKIAAALESRAP